MTILQYLNGCISNNIDESLLLCHFTREDIEKAERDGYLTREEGLHENSCGPDDKEFPCTHRINFKTVIQDMKRII